MALGLIDRAAIDTVAALADEYAERVLDDLPNVESEDELRNGLAGAFLSFLADAVLTVNNMRA